MPRRSHGGGNSRGMQFLSAPLTSALSCHGRAGELSLRPRNWAVRGDSEALLIWVKATSVWKWQRMDDDSQRIQMTLE